MKVSVVGATGMVGEKMLQVLEERNFPVTELIPVASEKSVGKEIEFKGQKYTVKSLETAVEENCDVALFSAGGGISLDWAPKFAAKGTVVVDNSSAWRMNEGIKLIVPEINADILTKEDKIIANPNCSTIQLVMVLNPLHQKYGIKRVVVSTYQSVTGTGKAAVDQLDGEIRGENPAKVYPYEIFKNALPHCDVFEENGYTKEEMKLTRETQKILDDKSIAVTATAVRVPVQGGHSEAVNIEFEKDFDESKVRKILNESPGITLQDNTDSNIYPMPKYAEGKNDVFVGRIRRDYSQPNSLNLWIVSDNLRKGAATNTVQIAEKLLEKKIIG
ncbi:Aspartate-semialdehyde dehydrogenase [Candidatus Ornithobacterium hominis]|uniref:aspartate-semialdehyde dehydrogenase n=1 Tax=Candidatus Ornithobacterium hominis TaxID=2497989 RepID=UPI000E5B22B7|nr:aspartate-semialdehyde dehydrogenase [Candidatus Ornithobacterium hominis]SZD72790.1 Aspartate-semialdehyde dehydrogenase [Candidatus Ornithobacterium hominis]